jgi:hypothetical protein
MTDLDRKIHEYGELERDAAQLADYSVHGGIFYRFWKWLERKIRDERELLIVDRDIQRRLSARYRALRDTEERKP